MKGKKELATLFFIIVVLVFYIYSEKKEKTHYSLPVIEKIQTDEITKINIKKKDSEIALVKESDKWVVGPNKYAADKSMVEKMLKAISELAITALASESKNYAIYELGDNNRVEVEAYKGDSILRTINVGKNAPTHNHTFVMIENDYRVFHAKGTIRREFDRTVSELRDKKVMAFHDEITELILKKGKEEITVVKISAPVSLDVTEKEKEEQKAVETAAKWTTADGKTVKEKEVDDIINTLSNFQCDKFIEDRKKEDFSSPVFTATLKGVKIYSISLFEKKDNQYPAISSESEYPFLISEWKANKIMKDLGSLIEEKK